MQEHIIGHERGFNMSMNQSSENLASGIKDSAENISDRLARVKDEALETKDKVMKNVKDKTSAVASDVAEQLGNQLERFEDRVEALSEDLRERLKMLDRSLHEKPYWYLAAAAAAGLSIGLLSWRMSNKSSKIV